MVILVLLVLLVQRVWLEKKVFLVLLVPVVQLVCLVKQVFLVNLEIVVALVTLVNLVVLADLVVMVHLEKKVIVVFLVFLACVSAIKVVMLPQVYLVQRVQKENAVHPEHLVILAQLVSLDYKAPKVIVVSMVYLVVQVNRVVME